MAAGSDVEIFRQPLALEGRSRRNFEDRLMVRFPHLLAVVSKTVWRLPSRSRLRRELIRRAVLSGWEAANRGDFDVALALYHPNVETVFDPRMTEVGFDLVYHGREARFAVQRRATAEWGEWRFEPEELISVGRDRMLTLGRMRGTGLMSGAAVGIDWGALFTMRDGVVVREQIFLDRCEALEAIATGRAPGARRDATSAVSR